MSDPYQKAIQLHRAGELDRAEAMYRAALDAQPSHAGAWHLLGVIHLQRGFPEQAVELIQRALTLEPNVAVVHNNLGAAWEKLGQFELALECFHAALAIVPRYPDALANVGLVCLKTGQLADALVQLEEALRLHPGHGDASQHMADALMMAGRPGEAIAHYQNVLAQKPRDETTHRALACAFQLSRREDEAERCLQECVALSPNNAETHRALAALDVTRGRITSAGRHLRQAIELRPDHILWRIAADLLVEEIPPSRQYLDDYTAHLRERLQHYEELPFHVELDQAPDSGCVLPFSLYHLAVDDRPLREAFGRVFTGKLPRHELTGKNSGRPRVGFIVTTGHEHIFLRWWWPLLKLLADGELEIVVACPAATAVRLQSVVAGTNVGVLPLTGTLTNFANQIRSARFDVLYHWEPGSDATNYFLALLRLAPLQCTSHGFQVTSGSPEMDEYVISDLLEREGAEADYVERLVRIKTLWASPPDFRHGQATLTRADLGWKESEHVYLCVQNLLKMHPDFDDVLGRILRTDSKAVIRLTAGKAQFWTEALQQRLQRSLPDVAHRIEFVPRVTSGKTYLDRMTLADVLLDTFPCGGATTACDAVAAGVPMVTLPTPQQRGRFTQACYRTLGIDAPVADSVDDYVRRAVAIATNKDLQQAIRSDITQRRETLFSLDAAATDFKEYFLNAAARSRDK